MDLSESHCPTCYAALETRDVAPCFDCGSDAAELDHLEQGQHTYTEVLAFWGSDHPLQLLFGGLLVLRSDVFQSSFRDKARSWRVRRDARNHEAGSGQGPVLSGMCSTARVSQVPGEGPRERVRWCRGSDVEPRSESGCLPMRAILKPAILIVAAARRSRLGGYMDSWSNPCE
jgi:hypothetical protein